MRKRWTHRAPWEPTKYAGSAPSGGNDELLFRLASPLQREILDRARADLDDAYMKGDMERCAAAFETMRKILAELCKQHKPTRKPI